MDLANKDEELWCAERREDVIEYLKRQGVTHGDVGEVPAWFVAPHISVWAVESLKAPGWVGWWVVSGDFPEDYCSADDCRHPRLAIKRIAERWIEEIKHTRPGDKDIGSTGLDVALIPLLQSRAALFVKMSDDDANWGD